MASFSICRFLASISTICAPLSADADVAAGGAIVAAVAPDERAVAALGAGRAGHHRILLGRGRLEDAHLRAREAVLVEDAEHGVAVHDEAREIGDRRGKGLLLAAAGHEGHEV